MPLLRAAYLFRHSNDEYYGSFNINNCTHDIRFLTQNDLADLYEKIEKINTLVHGGVSKLLIAGGILSFGWSAYQSWKKIISHRRVKGKELNEAGILQEGGKIIGRCVATGIVHTMPAALLFTVHRFT